MAHDHSHKHVYALGSDVHSWANYQDVSAEHYHIEIRVDFTRQIFFGFVDVTAKVHNDKATTIDFDTRGLAIERILDDGNNLLEWTLPKSHPTLGKKLSVELPDKKLWKNNNSTFKIRIYYNTTVLSGGIQWFTPQQTAGKKHPYCYTQGEAILARTIIPCQDTPAVKCPYSIKVSCPSPLVAACSGTPSTPDGAPTFEDDGFLSYSFEQKQPIPAYLIAIVVGALKKEKIGPRSSVYTEKELLAASVHEFKQDTENFIKAGEELLGIDYSWGLYDLVVLPNAFPYGGMENPNLTFLSASLLAGDRSLVNVVAHEITHSWCGNLVTNSSWSDFWLNEGFTVYVERLILGHTMGGSDYRHFEMLVGYNDLIKTVNDLGKDNEFTKLCPNLTGIDPDDAFSKIPYEKGSLFLYYLETKVGGPIKMAEWINNLYTQYKAKSFSTVDMKSHFLGYWKGKVDASVLDSIDWDTWLHKPGMPPLDPSEKLQNDLTKSCIALADKWLKHNGEGTSNTDLDSFKSKQKMYFLDRIITTGVPMNHSLIEKMDSLYKFSSTKNVEIGFRFLMLCLKSKFGKYLPETAKFLGIHGRGLYVRPLFRALHEFDHSFAVKVYSDNRNRYHSVIQNMYDDLLGK